MDKVGDLMTEDEEVKEERVRILDLLGRHVRGDDDTCIVA